MIRTTTALIVFVGSLSLTLAALVSGGLSVDIAGVEVTARNPARPFVVAGLAAAGSMCEYGERLTVRWDVLDPQWLDRAIEDLQARQYAVFIIVEAEEEQ